MSTQTPDEMLAEFAALEKRYKNAGRASEIEFNALDKRIKAAGYKAAPKPVEVPKTILPKPEEPPKPDECATICAAIKETEQNIIAAIQKEPEPAPPPEPPKPKGWKFTHRYDRYNKLVETIAEAV